MAKAKTAAGGKVANKKPARTPQPKPKPAPPGALDRAARKKTEARASKKPVAIKPVGPALKPSTSELGMALTLASRPRDELIRNWELVLALEIKPALDTRKLDLAFQHILNLHSRLRCVYQVRNGKVSVRTLPLEAFTLDERDGTALSESEFMAALQQLADQPWSMSTGPQIALTTYSRPKNRQVLLLRMNHLMVDGWSIEMLLRDMIMYYLGVPTSGVRAAGFDEFVAWEEAFNNSPEGRAQREFWRRKLAKLGPRLRLPYDRQPTSPLIHKSANVDFRLPQPQLEKMRDLSRRSGVSTYGIMLAVYQILLAHLADETDITVLATAARRSDPRFVNTVGMIANLIAFRGTVGRANSFAQQLSRAGRTIAEALGNQDCHIKIVGEDLAAEGFDHANNFGSAESPFDQVGLYMVAPNQSGMPDSGLRARFEPAHKFRVGPFEIRGLPIERSDCTRELTLFFNEIGDELFAYFSYSADLFDAETVEGFVEKFLRIADRALDRPEFSVQQLLDSLGIADM